MIAPTLILDSTKRKVRFSLTEFPRGTTPEKLRNYIVERYNPQNELTTELVKSFLDAEVNCNRALRIQNDETKYFPISHAK